MIELGREVEDRVSGFRGIAISRTTYLQGCDRIGVQPEVDSEGKLPDIKDFDEPDMRVVGHGIFAPKEKDDNGGPRHVAYK
jgi:hypothetical protein